ncbi:DUF4231 domain-containing protein [Streptomyces sp. SID13726]|uniref:DUF4231 domain-containing protein n=1 Tax=Streptomyces sp. SID13726 TaxID=2706058 RepID=UPI0013B7547F|nr:DUF4231 domain-containing protein [Streptomyces sp. SID13726]NEB01486.1 DUF4231 domain-containing protein [Streptomyces sp. SID13726]
MESRVPASRGEPAELRAAQPADVTWERLQDQLGWFDRKSGSAQRSFKRLKMATLILAAGLPVAIAASAPDWIAAAMGALVAVIEGAQQLFKFQENWISYRAVCESLRREQYLYLARAGHYADVEDADVLLAEQVEKITSQENALWAEREMP